uniref:Uncharacterized protein n=1 Tax=Pithovirus LCPAC101 TaxID=2506586 RepID=A0A481Z2J2_9VIRU|nr:MAG: hypothetical protein LCPAC101_02700 [Pithovirus LCPAC101]
MGNIGVWATSSLKQKTIYYEDIDAHDIKNDYISLLDDEFLKCDHIVKYTYHDDIKDECFSILNEVEQGKNTRKCIVHLHHNEIMAIQVTMNNSSQRTISVNTVTHVSDCLQGTSFGYKILNVQPLSTNGKL